ncbi:CehA/McbA family metallohydrolase [Acidobacteria bacterium AH-259-O06]|nr:CehA/McbA family metallohydrolase [Acidobacteria bacterium AH-259-O06]
MRGQRIRPASLVLLLYIAGFAWQLQAHEHHGHRGPTYEVRKSIEIKSGEKKLQLTVIDQQTGKPTAARFSLMVNGASYTPHGLGKNGLRFVSIHQGRGQRFVALYTRGSGDVEVPLPANARGGVVLVTKGFDFFPEQISFEVKGDTAKVNTKLWRWTDIRAQGWLPADEHLHYDRLDPAHDKDWLTILDADGLTHAHFLVLKGGNLPGVWARQFAHGKAGEVGDGQRLIRPGEEYRDGSQGHINLLGIGEVILPISTGGIGRPQIVYNYPPLYDILQRTRAVGGIGGPAHGGTLSRSPTAVLDTVLGGVDFFELANTHLYEVDVWYRLMNCGYVVPPAAGTDLPNFPFRDSWQPLMGETRMYVRVGPKQDFPSWKEAVRRGEVFISSGPIIKFAAGGAEPGGVIQLPAVGGDVLLEAELASPRHLQALEIVHNGTVVTAPIRKTNDGPIHRWRIRQRLRITESSWLAARGVGAAKRALEEHTTFKRNAIAHTAAIRVLVGDQPIRSSQDAKILLRQLRDQQEYYRTQAKYEQTEHRTRFLQLFDSAIAEIKRQAN